MRKRCIKVIVSVFAAGVISTMIISVLVVYLTYLYNKEGYEHIPVVLAASTLLLAVSILYTYYFYEPLKNKLLAEIVTRGIGILGSTVVLIIYVYKRKIDEKDHFPYEPYVIYSLYGATVGMFISKPYSFVDIQGIIVPDRMVLTDVYIVFMFFATSVYYAIVKSFFSFSLKTTGMRKKLISFIVASISLGFFGILITIFIPIQELSGYELYFIMGGAYIILFALVKYPSYMFTLYIDLKSFFILTREGIAIYTKTIEKNMDLSIISGYLVFFSLIFDRLPISTRQGRWNKLVLEHENTIIFLQRDNLISVAILKGQIKEVLHIQKRALLEVERIARGRDPTGLTNEELDKINERINQLLKPIEELAQK